MTKISLKKARFVEYFKILTVIVGILAFSISSGEATYCSAPVTPGTAQQLFDTVTDVLRESEEELLKEKAGRCAENVEAVSREECAVLIQEQRRVFNQSLAQAIPLRPYVLNARDIGSGRDNFHMTLCYGDKTGAPQLSRCSAQAFRGNLDQAKNAYKPLVEGKTFFATDVHLYGRFLVLGLSCTPAGTLDTPCLGSNGFHISIIKHSGNQKALVKLVMTKLKERLSLEPLPIRFMAPVCEP